MSLTLQQREALGSLGYLPFHLAEIEAAPNFRYGPRDHVSAITERDAVLASLGYTKDQVIEIVSNRGYPSEKLDEAIHSHSALSRLGYGNGDIARMLGWGSHNTIEDVLKFHTTLSRLGYTPEDVTEMVSNDDAGAEDLEAIALKTPSLYIQGYTRSQIVRMVSGGAGEGTVHSADTHTRQLYELGFKHIEVVDIFSAPYGGEAVPVMVKYHEYFRKANITNSRILKLLDEGADAQEMEIIATSILEGANAEDIEAIVKSIHAQFDD